MANYSTTYSGDFTTYIAGKIFDAANMAKGERERAQKEAAKYGVDPKLKRGEFFGRALQSQFGGDLYNRTLGVFDPRKSFAETDRKSSREARYSAQFRYPDRLARGQSSQFASPLPRDYFMRGQTSKLPSASQRAASAGQPFPFLAVGSSLSNQAKPKQGPVNEAPKITSTVDNTKPVKVRDRKLGVFLAEVARSLSSSIENLNDRLDETEAGIISAKEGIAGTVRQLEYNSNTLEEKLDAIISALKGQISLAKKQEDKTEVSDREREQEIENDRSGTERFVQLGQKKEEAQQLSLLENAEEFGSEETEQLNLPILDGEGFERGGIVSGPDSGYYAKLHGDEMVIPVDNNYTQGEPSAIDGKIAPKPTTPMLPKYEMGTKPLVKPKTQPTKRLEGNIFNTIVQNEPQEIPNLSKETEKLHEAMQLPVKTAGIITMSLLQEAVSSMKGMGSGVADQLRQVAAPIAAAFGVNNSITANLTRQKEAEVKTAERGKETKEFSPVKTGKKKKWWDFLGLFSGKDDGGEGGGYRRGGSGGPASWLGTQWNKFSNFVTQPFRQPQGLARGTSGVRAGFTGMNKQGFDAMMQGQGYRASTKPQILGHGAYSAPTLKGAQRYAGATGSLGGMQTPGGVVNSIVPGNAPRINIIEPQMKVKPEMFNKGRDLATKLQSGAYPNSARANMLRAQITTGGARPPMPKSSIRPGNPLSMLIQLIADELMNPRAAGMYDQISGPNAYYNAPGYTGPKPQNLQPPAAAASAKAAFVDLGSQQQSLSRLSRGANNAPVVINNQQASTNVSSEVQQRHIANVGDPGISKFYPSPY